MSPCTFAESSNARSASQRMDNFTIPRASDKRSPAYRTHPAKIQAFGGAEAPPEVKNAPPAPAPKFPGGLYLASPRCCIPGCKTNDDALGNTIPCAKATCVVHQVATESTESTECFEYSECSARGGRISSKPIEGYESEAFDSAWLPHGGGSNCPTI